VRSIKGKYDTEARNRNAKGRNERRRPSESARRHESGREVEARPFEGEWASWLVASRSREQDGWASRELWRAVEDKGE